MHSWRGGCHANFILIIYLAAALYRRKFCDGHIKPVLHVKDYQLRIIPSFMCNLLPVATYMCKLHIFRPTFNTWIFRFHDFLIENRYFLDNFLNSKWSHINLIFSNFCKSYKIWSPWHKRKYMFRIFCYFFHTCRSFYVQHCMLKFFTPPRR